ncbi:hypothetical protein O4444_05005 [Xylella fastidiosa subsp. pauca]|uniref:hypothetical protein n=1 Tax=Xylella fastidiosa TaxID=2371 RepID=UPI00249E5BCF|nr:hypothetical protein [Xylella fastidiosa]WGZ32955.1 hypothetical protein O4444_05005 [Xylella fastidiosa subsp. pauca]
MITVETRKPCDGMSFKSLGGPFAVSSVPVTDPAVLGNAYRKKRLLLASIRKLAKDLNLVKSKFENLECEACGIGMYSERRYVSRCIQEAHEYMARFLGDIEDGVGV